MKCEKCGETLRNGAKFCDKCGSKVCEQTKCINCVTPTKSNASSQSKAESFNKRGKEIAIGILIAIIVFPLIVLVIVGLIKDAEQSKPITEKFIEKTMPLDTSYDFHSLDNLGYNVLSEWYQKQTDNGYAYSDLSGNTMSVSKYNYKPSLTEKDYINFINLYYDKYFLKELNKEGRYSFDKNCHLYSGESLIDENHIARLIIFNDQDAIYSICFDYKESDFEYQSIITQLEDMIKFYGKAPEFEDDSVDSVYEKETTERPTPEEPTTEEPTTAEPKTESPVEKHETVIFNNLGIKITCTGVEESRNKKNVKLRIENNSGYDYTFQVRDVSVNGYMISPIFSCDVKNGKIANDKLSFWADDLEENNISEIDEIELSINAFNWDDDSHDFDSEMITFNP